jgi:hypothetical protein
MTTKLPDWRDREPTPQPLALKSNLVLGPNAQDIERVRFEAWMDGLQFNLRRHADRPHQYSNASVQGRWVTWQAAAADMKARWMEACSAVSAGAEAAGRPGVQTVTQIRLLALGPN